MSAAPDGLLIIAKPTGMTSHDVVARVRRLTRTRKVGHAGTLDPDATGVLVIGIGRATRLLGHLSGQGKNYSATVRLGVTTLTDDAAGEVLTAPGVAALGDDLGLAMAQVLAAAQTLSGEILQVPSAVSAIKVDGERAYDRVRRGEDVVLAARPVTVSSLELSGCRAATSAAGVAVLDVELDCHVSSGTYVRALARDLGAALGTGGHLTRLSRTASGPFSLAQSHPLQSFLAADGNVDAELVDRAVLPLAAAMAMAFGVRRVDAETARIVSHGGRLARDGEADGPVAVLGPDGQALALMETDGARLIPLAVLAGG